MTPDQKKVSLQRYAVTLEQRLSGAVPEKYKHRQQVFKDMIKLDLKRTLKKISEL